MTKYIQHLSKLMNTCLLFVYVLGCLCTASSVWCVNPVVGYDQLIEYLAEEKTSLTLSLHDASLWVAPVDTNAVLLESQRTQESMLINQAEREGLLHFLTSQREKEAELQDELKQLQNASFAGEAVPRAQERIDGLTLLRDANNKAMDLIQDNLSLVAQLREVLVARTNTLALVKLTEATQTQQLALREKYAQLEAQRNRLYQSNIALIRQKKTQLRFQKINPYDDLLVSYNNQMIALLDDQMRIVDAESKRIDANMNYLKYNDIGALEALIGIIEKTLTQNQRILSSWSGVPQATCDTLTDLSLKQACIATHEAMQTMQHNVLVEQQILAKQLLDQQSLLRKKLASRQNLVDFSLNAWLQVVSQIIQIPLQCYAYIGSLVDNVTEQYLWQDRLQNGGFFMLQMGILSIGYAVNRWLSRFTQEKARSRLSAHLYDGFLVLVYRNIPFLTASTVLLVTLLYHQVLYAHYRLLIHMVFVWFITRQFILIARLTLLERVTDAAGHDVTLYHRLKWLLLMGGWSTALMIYSHEFPLSFLLQDIFDRVFMLIILAISWVIWRSRDAIYYVFPSLLTSKKSHVRHVVYLLGWFIPIILLTTALLGLMGYINLAWTMSRYEADFLFFVTAYVLLRGVVRDGLDLLCEWMVSSLHNGWLWVEALLKPIDKLMRFMLLASFVLLFVYWVGLLSDPKFIAAVEALARYPLINLAGVYITLFSLSEFIVLLLIFIWATKWSREFCYRWLYARVSDPGVRNSCSVFSQYAVIVFGFFFTLRVLGIDFTGMMVVLGGLAVGMGFGLRDFASNIVGGIMLLIERPVREGDLITIGEHEGRVAHIGIRSMRVSSWDNMEVLVPNAETFNKPFTNWTHQDSVVRTVIPIKVSRADDPAIIQPMIYNVLAEIPEILNDPAPQVYLKQIDEALLEFEVRYFINVQLHTRFEIRSKALLAIMSQFKLAGIEPPIPPLAVELKSTREME